MWNSQIHKHFRTGATNTHGYRHGGQKTDKFCILLRQTPPPKFSDSGNLPPLARRQRPAMPFDREYRAFVV